MIYVKFRFKKLDQITSKTLTGLFLFLLFPLIGYSQILGTVTDSLSQPIPFATVLLKKSQDSSLVTYTQTSKDGYYKITAKETTDEKK